MTISNARDKICPFISAPVHAPSGEEGVGGISEPIMVFCYADLCMAWEKSPLVHTEPNEGYCKLVEEGMHH